jgi:hypothetical protein
MAHPAPASVAPSSPSFVTLEDGRVVTKEHDDLLWGIAGALADERANYKRQIGKLRTEISELRGRVDLLVTLLERKADPIALPPSPKGRDAS